jgi:hypothetical protein
MTVTRRRYGELYPLVEKVGGGILKADTQTAVVTANVVKHCIWLLQRPQVADIAAILASNLLAGLSKIMICMQLCSLC